MRISNIEYRISKIFAFCIIILIFEFWILRLTCYAYEPPRYEIDAKVDTGLHRITAQQKVTFTNNSENPINAVYFHIYPHRKYNAQEIRFIYRYAGYFKINPFPEGFQSGGLKINAISASGKAVNYQIEGEDQTLLKINLDSPLLPGQSQEIQIDFAVSIPHAYNRFGWHKDIITLTRWYPILSVLDKSGWHNYPYYLYHHPYFSDAAFYSVRVNLNRQEKVAASGLTKKETVNPDGSKTLFIESESALRDFSLGISRAFEVYSLKDKDLKINAYYLKGDAEKAKEAAQCAWGIIKFYSARFGKYPYSEFNIVPAFLGYGGEQSSGQVFIDTRVYKLPGFLSRYFDFFISHETGHQWFYNIVGSDEYREMFLDEGMNSYWILEYLENKYGRDAKVMILPKYLDWFVPNFSFRDSSIARYLFLAKNGFDRPVIGELSSFHEPSSIFALTYGKGAAVLEMLKRQLGSDIFLKIIQRYMQEYRFKNISLEDFIRIASETSGKDLKEFFYTWLKTKEIIDVKVKSVSSKQIILENRGTIEMPVNTKIVYIDGREIIDRWDGKGKNRVLALEGKIKQVEVDPDNAILLDLDRTNNYWPRKINLKPVPLYYFAYEIPVFAPRQAYNLVVGPSLGGSGLGVASSLAKPYDNILRLSANYDFSDRAVESKLGYEFNHVFHRQNSLGFEIFNYESSREKHDLSGGKLYFRRELWPASYGIFETNDHISFYFIRDQKLERTTGLTGSEEIKNLHYLKRNEAIIGVTGFLGRYGPYPDPDYGWRFIPTQEFAGHFLGGHESFWRMSLELNNYHLLLPKAQHKIATRLKLGWGEPSDKNLFQLGGWEGLRGYNSKTIEGAHMLLGSLEYRFPLASDTKIYFMDNLLSIEKIQGVGFLDIGRTWYADFSDAPFKKDAGLGLRFFFSVAGFLEKMVLRIDIAQAINEHKEKPHLWFGLSHNF